MPNSNLDDLKATVAAALDVPVQEIVEDSSGLTIPQWDSVGHLTIIMALEERFGTSFTVDEMIWLAQNCSVAAAVTAAIAQHAVRTC